jgi:hypothetical protein
MVKKEFTKVISQSQDDRLRIKIETERGKVLDMVVQYEAKFEEEWHPIVRYDCSHGFLHRDIMFPGGKKEKHLLDIADLNSALLYAEQDIKDRWGW